MSSIKINSTFFTFAVCFFALAIEVSSQTTNKWGLSDPFNEIERDIGNIRSHPEDVSNPWASTLSEDEYLFFRKRLDRQDPDAALALVRHYRDFCQRCRYTIRAARWGSLIANLLMAENYNYNDWVFNNNIQEKKNDTLGSGYWLWRGAILGSDDCREKLRSLGDNTSDWKGDYAFLKASIRPDGLVIIGDLGFEGSNQIFGATWPGVHLVTFCSEKTNLSFLVEAGGGEMTSIQFDTEKDLNPKISHVSLSATNLPMVCDIGFRRERSFMLGSGIDTIFVRIDPGTYPARRKISTGQYWNRVAFEKGRKTQMDHSYWLSRYPTTKNVFDAVMGREIKNAPNGHYPVEVTWEKAREFCRRLTKMQREAGMIPKNMYFDLPTEAEWEYALLAGRRDVNKLSKLCDPKMICSIGDESLTWELDHEGWFNWNDAKRYCKRVGQKEPNARGLYDMIGLPFEICLDEWKGGPETLGEGHTIRGSGEVFSERMILPFDKSAAFRICLKEDRTNARASQQTLNEPTR